MPLPVKRGVEAIVYKELGLSKYYLVLHRILNWRGWEFPKGGIEEGETPEQALLRELAEETSLKAVEIMQKLPEKKEWQTKDTSYSYDVFLVRCMGEEHIRLARGVVEHDDFKWATATQVRELLTHENSRKAFEQALAVANTQTVSE